MAHREDASDAQAAPSPRRPRVFLSYARKDQARVGNIVKALEAADIDVWWDTALEAGSAFRARTAEQLDTVDAIVVVWSQNSVASPWVLDEAEVGRARNNLVPLTLDGTIPPLGFRQLQTVDVSTWRGIKRPNTPLPKEVVAAILQIHGEPAPPRPAPAQRPSFGLLAAIGGLAVAVIIAAALWRFWPQSTVSQAPMVAVLPFENLSAKPGAQLFAAGLSEEIIDTIARDKRLRVLGRASAGAIGAAWAKDPDFARRKLGVGWILEGSVRGGQDSNPVRVSVRLIDTADGSEQWTQGFDWGGRDAASIQAEIARKVATSIVGPVAGAGADKVAAAKEPAVPEAAYSRILVARELIRTRQADALQRARALASEAIAIAPGYAPAFAARSSAAALLSVAGGQDAGALRLSARADAERAIMLDPSSAAGFDSLGLALWLNSEREPALKAAQRAIELQPRSAEALLHLAAWCGFLAKYDCAITNFEESASIDPLFVPPVASLLSISEISNRPGVGMKAVNRLVSLATDTATIDWAYAERAARSGRLAEALLRSKAAVLRNPKLTIANLQLAAARDGLFIVDGPTAAKSATGFAGLGFANATALLARTGQLDGSLWDDPKAAGSVAWALLALGRSDALVKLYDARFRDTAEYAAAAAPAEQASAPLAFALARAGRRADAEAIHAVARRNLDTLDTAGTSLAQTAHSRAALALEAGDRAGAVARLQQGLAIQWWVVCRGPVWIGSNPIFAPIAGDAGFQRVVQDCTKRLNAERKVAGLAPA